MWPTKKGEEGLYQEYRVGQIEHALTSSHRHTKTKIIYKAIIDMNDKKISRKKSSTTKDIKKEIQQDG